ncbi:MAG: thermonuclease family protein [Candidatus Hadarchaeota archaeon]
MNVKLLAAFIVAIAAASSAAGYAAFNSPSPNQAGAAQASARIERTAVVDRVVDGDTIYLVGGEKVRMVGVNTPETRPTPEPGGLEAKEFTENICRPGVEIGLDVDDLEPKDKYNRTLAVVYVKDGGEWMNLNAELLRRGLARVLFIPPSEFNPYEWAN